MKGKRRRRRKVPSAARTQKIDRLAAKLAPLEEVVAPSRVTQEGFPEEDFVDGTIIVDGQHLPAIDPFGEDVEGPWLEPVLLVVTALALAFIAAIALLIAAEPENADGDDPARQLDTGMSWARQKPPMGYVQRRW